MQVNLLKDVVVSVAGPNSEKIVDLLFGKKNVNEFIIAKKLDLNINQTRNILYKLSEFGLVSFIRKKDQKNGGWYTYFWTLDSEKSLFILKEQLEKNIKAFEDQLNSRQTKRFYYCPECGMEMSEENALVYNFTCPECGEVLNLRESEEIVKELNTRLEDLRSKLKVVDAEVAEALKKGDQARQRKARAEERKKAKEREERRKLRELERAKLKGKKKAVAKKKPSKKKTPAKRKTTVKKKAVSKKRTTTKKKVAKKKAVAKKKPSKKKTPAKRKTTVKKKAVSKKRKSLRK